MPEVVRTIREVRDAVDAARARGARIGLVPTMGALHAGHVRLMEQCRIHAGFVVVSVFVNPTQFGPAEDLAKYPRTLDEDRLACDSAGVDLIFAPEVEVMYPNGPDSTFVEVPGISRILEGTTRPGHFRGVATVVLKLLEVVRPDVAIFGQKDFQQQVIVRRMVEDLRVPTEIRVMATAREHDGLAMSSRNRYLNPTERQAATVLSQALATVEQVVRDGERDASRIRQILRDSVESEPGVRLDYAEVVDSRTLESFDRIEAGREAVALLAAWVGTTRLIDNAILME
jgi:pantoate--beta-alanine ligase